MKPVTTFTPSENQLDPTFLRICALSNFFMLRGLTHSGNNGFAPWKIGRAAFGWRPSARRALGVVSSYSLVRTRLVRVNEIRVAAIFPRLRFRKMRLRIEDVAGCHIDDADF